MSETLGPDVATPTPPPLPPPAAKLECANCGGALLFTPGAGATTCIQCASTFPIAADGTVGAEHALEAAVSDPRAREGGDTGTTATDVLDRELVCPNCQGAVAFVGTLTATRCPFCGRPVTSDDVRAAPDRFPVDGIVPFGLDQKAAEKHVRDWMSQRKWAPTAFQKRTATGTFSGVYLPFFTFDADTATDYRGRRGTTRTRTVTDKDGKTRTESYIDWEPWEDGHVETKLDDVPISAESSVDRGRMQDLEPWPTTDAVPFRPEYVAGFLARRYDRSLEQCLTDVRPRMNDLVDEAIKGDIGGQHQEIKSKHTAWSNETFRHLLLPVYLLVVTFRSKPYQIAVNGVTGEVHGKRPYSWAKIGAAALAAVIAATAFGIYAWKHDSTTTSSTPVSTTDLTVDQRLEQARQDAAARAAAAPPVVYTPQQCETAVRDYRLQIQDTYFPAVPQCVDLSSAERTRIARELFQADQVSAARRELIDIYGIPHAPKQDICRSQLALAGAKIAAKTNTPADERDVAGACSGLSPATVDQLSDDVADEYLEKRKQALADAP